MQENAPIYNICNKIIFINNIDIYHAERYPFGADFFDGGILHRILSLTFILKKESM